MNARVKPPAQGEAEPVSVTLEKVEQQPAVPSPAVAPQQAAAPVAPPQKPKRKGRRLALLISVPVILAAAGAYFWLTGGRFVDTDNAYVQQPKVALSADIAGRIIDVKVHENQVVKAGDVLFDIDPAPYKIALDKANAALASARVNVDQLRVGYTTAQAKLSAAKSTQDIRQRVLGRNDSLAGKGFATAAAVDDVRISAQDADTAVALAQQEVAGAVAALGGNPTIVTDDHPAVQTAQAAVASAKRDLANTSIVAPADGIISQVASLNVGQFVAPGSTIASLVETGDTWVVANFKETQLTTLKDGQPADVTVDAYPGVKLAGHVDSIGAATGSEFSLIPAQNATGNWVKVGQRIPVRIKVDGTSAQPLRTGMSAAVSVDTKPEGTVATK
ncbi:MAG: Membrane fusion component of tripartite multidrug resistance system [Hyphomicrobiales bacterium]|nr:Membrane fusion component of tripartite multidrug resistance system [Hyphomicrobiales bacterium]